MIAVLNGPNLNQLGQREQSIYGNFSLNDIEESLKKIADNTALLFFQSNHEGDFIDFIHSLPEKNCKGIIINAGAWTHTSIALRDALLAVNLPFIEVHISNVYQREDFRHKSFLSDKAVGVIAGLGMQSYHFALNYFKEDNS